MFSKSLYFNVVFRVSLIIILSALTGYFTVIDKSLRFSIICILALIVVTVNLVSYLNNTNRKIKFFFDSVRNEDSNLSFPSDAGSKALKELYQSMNKVNRQIQQLKIENRQQEQYFGILIEHLATGIISFDDKEFIIHSNSSAKKLLSMDVLTHLKQIEQRDRRLYEAIRNIKPYERKLVAIQTDNGEIQLSLKATSLKKNEDELVILSIQDIKNELDEKEIDSWMKLIRVLMHEIMNSITPITSLSESLSNIYGPGGKPVQPENIDNRTVAITLQGLNVIKEQGKGLMSFVESYRKLTRIPEPSRKFFRVKDLLDRLQVIYNSLENSDKVQIEVKLKDPELEIFADQNLISQVLLNLLKNALEANEANTHGKIMIMACISDNNRTEICVIDNGPGIPEEHLDEIFVPFYTTKPNGSGIGLSISRQIMKAHGGNLKVKSVTGQETSFCLSF